MAIYIDSKLDEIMKIYTLLNDDTQTQLWTAAKKYAEKEGVQVNDDVYK